jgi:signal transduction histidine kinase
VAISAGETAHHERRLARLVERVTALGRHRVLVVVLVVAAIAGALVLDIRYVSYPVAGFYLVPVTLAALTLRVRESVVVAVLCLALAIYVIVAQGRLDGPTVTVVAFSALSGAALIAIAWLFAQVVHLYETERSAAQTLASLAAQLQALEEVVVLDTDKPLADLLGRVIAEAGRLLSSDGCAVYRYEPETRELRLATATGSGEWDTVVPLARSGDPLVHALEAREPVTLAGDDDGGGALLAVPLMVREESQGVLALRYGGRRRFGDLDLRLAASFGAQVAMAVENARLRDQIGRNAAVEERLRLARDLHDSVTQSLFAASLKAEAVCRRWEPSSEEARENVHDVERLTRGALAEMRILLMEMRPDALAEAPLATLFGQLAAAAEASSRISVHLDVRPGDPVPQRVSLALFRIAQESLQNVNRHSGASGVWVMLDLSGAVVRLEVRDDGCGFDAADVTPEHLGLAMMRERAADAGVRIAVDGRPGNGTTVTAEWRRDGGTA